MRPDNTLKSTSRVEPDLFDPVGVQELSQTLCQSSVEEIQKSILSDSTLASEQPFSLEKTLRVALDRCAPSDSHRNGWSHKTFIGNMVPISREGSSEYTSGAFALLVSVPQCPTKQLLGLRSIPKLSGRSTEMHFDRPRE